MNVSSQGNFVKIDPKTISNKYINALICIQCICIYMETIYTCIYIQIHIMFQTRQQEKKKHENENFLFKNERK